MAAPHTGLLAQNRTQPTTYLSTLLCIATSQPPTPSASRSVFRGRSRPPWQRAAWLPRAARGGASCQGAMRCPRLAAASR
eukprot:2945960-Rhodomonas_salina.2